MTFFDPIAAPRESTARLEALSADAFPQPRNAPPAAPDADTLAAHLARDVPKR